MLELIFRDDTKLFIVWEIFILLTFEQFRYLTAPVYLGLSYAMCKNTLKFLNGIFGKGLIQYLVHYFFSDNSWVLKLYFKKT